MTGRGATEGRDTAGRGPSSADGTGAARMTGGRPALRTWISSEPIDPATLLRRLGDERDGGVALFVGRVRAWNHGRRVTSLLYEAYGEMAEEELSRIASEVASRAAVGAIAAVHRVGELEPGEVAVAVAVAAPHRAAAFEVARSVVEEIKARLPVWKRETYADGDTRWLGEGEAGAADGAGRAMAFPVEGSASETSETGAASSSVGDPRAGS